MCVGFKLIAVWHMSQCESGRSSCVVPDFTNSAGRGLYCWYCFYWEFKPAVMPFFLAMFVFHCFHRLDMDINEKLATSCKLIKNGFIRSTVSVKNKSYRLVVRVPSTFCNYLHLHSEVQLYFLLIWLENNRLPDGIVHNVSPWLKSF